MIVDCHSHFFSRAFFEGLAAGAPGAGTVEERFALVSSKGIEIPPAAGHEERWLHELERHGVDHLVTFASHPAEIEVVAAAVAAAAGRMSWLSLVDPRAAGAVDRVEKLISDRGLRGVLLFPALHGYSVADVEVEPLFELLEARGAIALIHCGLFVVPLRDLLGYPRTQDLRLANPLDIVPVANRHRAVRFVIPHFGAGFFREALLAGAQCDNVFVDSSSSNSWIATQPGVDSLLEVFETTLDVFGAERLLFGTDSSTFPAGWRSERLAEQRDLLGNLGVSATDQDRIFGGNAADLFGLA